MTTYNRGDRRAMTLAAGSHLGPYAIVSPLGAGGMGEVYRARDTRLGRDVAIKVLPAQFAADPDRLRRFEEEARAIAGLNHPHICQIYDVGPGYLVLEYIDGAPPRGPVPPDDAVRLGLQIVSAIEAAHRRNILHRDLKPANILITRDGTAKLLDFGLAKLMAGETDITRTMDGAVLGTAAYMSPEQAQGRTLDARSDVFSLGAVLYELLSGTGPFTGSSIAEVLSAVLRDDPRPLDAPPPLERLVSRCLAKSPAHRFQTMADVRMALEQLSETAGAQQPSIAVLPFADMSEARDQQWFSDGLAEEIINALTHIPGLKVTARTSAFAFRGKAQDITAIAAALRVRTILEGSIRRAGNRIRVTTQLINAEDGYHLWAERYDRDLTDIFAIQDDIARAIARALQVQLSEAAGAQRQRAASFAAYEAYLKGRHHLYKFTPESLQRSRQHFEQAIALDQTFAAAHSGLGFYFFAMSGQGFIREDEALAQLRVEAQLALSFDASLPEAHVLLAILASSYNFDWQAAEREFHAAMARQPVDPFARDHYAAFFLLQVGRIEEASAEIDRALQDDPLNLLFRVHRGMCLFAAGRDSDAVSQYLEVLDIDPDNYLAHLWLFAAYAALHAWPDARRHGERAFALSAMPAFAGALAGIALHTGDRARADALLEPLADDKSPGSAVGLALCHLTHESSEALVWFARALERHERMVLLPVLFRRFCASSPRWPAVAKMMNLPG